VYGVDHALSGCIFNLYLHLIRTYSCYSTVARYKCHSTPAIGPCISLTARSQGYFRCHLNSYCNRLMSARDGGWLPGTAKSPSPTSPRPSGRHCGVRTGRTALAPSRPSWRNLGRPTVPGRPTGWLTSLTEAREVHESHGLMVEGTDHKICMHSDFLCKGMAVPYHATDCTLSLPTAANWRRVLMRHWRLHFMMFGMMFVKCVF